MKIEGALDMTGDDDIIEAQEADVIVAITAVASCLPARLSAVDVAASLQAATERGRAQALIILLPGISTLFQMCRRCCCVCRFS